MNPDQAAAALETIARGFADLAAAVRQAGGSPPPRRPQGPPAQPQWSQQNAPPGTYPSAPTGQQESRACWCGGQVEYAEWTSKQGRRCRAWRCVNSRANENHYIEWVGVT